MEDILQVGAIASTHGVRGEVKVYPMTDDVERFKDLKEVLLDTGREMKLLHVKSCKFFKTSRFLSLRSLTISMISNSINAAGCLSQERMQSSLKRMSFSLPISLGSMFTGRPERSWEYWMTCFRQGQTMCMW